MNTAPLTKRNHTALVLILVLLIAVLAFALLKSYTTKEVSFGLAGSQTNAVKGSEFTVDVSLKDSIEDPVTAYEIFIEYDKSKVVLVKADHGGYFTDPLQVKWDTTLGQFSAAANPAGFKDSAIKVNSENPLLRLTFRAIDSVDSSQITISDKSQVYVSQKGALTPGSVEIRYSVQ